MNSNVIIILAVLVGLFLILSIILYLTSNKYRTVDYSIKYIIRFPDGPKEYEDHYSLILSDYVDEDSSGYYIEKKDGFSTLHRLTGYRVIQTDLELEIKGQTVTIR